jgi:hypothetical protein
LGDRTGRIMLARSGFSKLRRAAPVTIDLSRRTARTDHGTGRLASSHRILIELRHIRRWCR